MNCDFEIESDDTSPYGISPRPGCYPYRERVRRTILSWYDTLFKRKKKVHHIVSEYDLGSLSDLDIRSFDLRISPYNSSQTSTESIPLPVIKKFSTNLISRLVRKRSSRDFKDLDRRPREICETYEMWIENGMITVNVIADEPVEPFFHRQLAATATSSGRDFDGNQSMEFMIGRFYTTNTLTMARYKLGDMLMEGRVRGNRQEWRKTLIDEDEKYLAQCEADDQSEEGHQIQEEWLKPNPSLKRPQLLEERLKSNPIIKRHKPQEERRRSKPGIKRPQLHEERRKSNQSLKTHQLHEERRKSNPSPKNSCAQLLQLQEERLEPNPSLNTNAAGSNCIVRAIAHISTLVDEASVLFK